MKMSDCIAVVTGGASGLGEATVRNFVAKGGKAAILDVQEERGQKLALELGSSAIFAKTDVTSEESVGRALDQVISAFGRVPIGCIRLKFPQDSKGIIPCFNEIRQSLLAGAAYALMVFSRV